MDEYDNNYWFNRYKKEISTVVIPLYQVMGNQILYEKFNNDENAVYEYCVEHKLTWEEVLKYEENPFAIY